MQRLLVCLFVLGACAGDTDDPPVGDGTFGAACATVSSTSTECDSKVCTDTFDQIGHPVCSQTCTFGMDSTCPAGASGPKCNMKGFCKP